MLCAMPIAEEESVFATLTAKQAETSCKILKRRPENRVTH